MVVRVLTPSTSLLGLGGRLVDLTDASSALVAGGRAMAERPRMRMSLDGPVLLVEAWTGGGAEVRACEAVGSWVRKLMGIRPGVPRWLEENGRGADWLVLTWLGSQRWIRGSRGRDENDNLKVRNVHTEYEHMPSYQHGP